MGRRSQLTRTQEVEPSVALPNGQKQEDDVNGVGEQCGLETASVRSKIARLKWTSNFPFQGMTSLEVDCKSSSFVGVWSITYLPELFDPGSSPTPSSLLSKLSWQRTTEAP